MHSRVVRELLLSLGDYETDKERGQALNRMTTSAALVVRAVHRLYKRAFVKAVYTALRDGAPVHPHDIALVCVDTRIALAHSAFLSTR
jgi:hypothetical protein